ncbi:MAG: hypothetical protein C5B59_03470 [Bacteroidetes bacterium]|nr:MAG: hypothetical protein C5B59_03470 [Bacteroidota bacterium]
MKILKLVPIVFSVIAMVAIGCKKGDTGPAGPAGPAGPDSVIYSGWITLNTPRSVSAAGDTSYSQTLTAASITQAVLDKAVIVSYFNVPDSAGDHIFPTASIGLFASETFSVGKIDLFSLVDLTGLQYRYVIIYGKIQANKIISGPATGMTVQQLKNMSYKDVQQLVLGSPYKVVSN